MDKRREKVEEEKGEGRR